MSSLTLRSFQSQTDLEAIATLARLSNAGQLDEDTSICELQLQLETSTLDKERDLRLWEDETGSLIAFSRLLIPDFSNTLDGYLWFCIHPQQSQSLELEILTWAEQRLQEVAQTRNQPTNLRIIVNDDLLGRMLLLEQQGFQPDRRFLTMGYPLPILQTPQLPNGFQVRSLQSDEIQSWVDLYNESFIDHWNHHDISADMVKPWLERPNYNPTLNLVAVSPQGTLAAFCYAHKYPHETEGWIKLLGTRRGFRKMGLGKAMLLAGMQRLQQAGATTVKLGVDADSPTGATKLYESIGFQTWKRWVYYVKSC